MVLKTITLSLALLALIGLPPALGALAAPEDKPAARDDALDDLLKKVEENETKDADKPAAPQEGAPAPPADKPAGEVATKDKDLDSLLEKLGATDDKPTAEERRPGPGGPGEPRPDPKKEPGKGEEKKNDPGSLSGKDLDLDEHLKEASGQRTKKKRPEDDGEGPLSQVTKQMREVEERLGKPDTGDETRKKQSEIVKKIDTLIEQARNAQGQSQGKKKSLTIAKGKQQPGQQNGDQAGTTGGNAPFTKPQKPTDRRSLAGGKELWGDLPPEVRQDLDNVMKEGFLPSREDLIRRYYLSLSKKKATRGE